jgi:hypothetical protein
MSVSELLDRLVARVGSGWTRSTGDRNLLSYIDMGQRELLNSLTARKKYRDGSNQGDPPFLLTTAGAYEYEVSAATLSCGEPTMDFGTGALAIRPKEVLSLFVDITSFDYNSQMRFVGEPFLYSEYNPYSTKTTRLYMQRVYVDSSPAYEEKGPRVIFLDDPGTTTDRYFIEFTWRPPKLVSEYIPLAIPEEYERALEDYVIGYVQSSEHGGISDLMTKFEQEWTPKFKAEYNKPARPRSTKVTLRAF